MTQRESGVEQAARVLPLRLRSGVMSLPEDRRSQIEELRLRVGLPMAAVLPEGERALAGPPVTQQELEQLLELASRASVHAVLDQLSRGYLTVQGGHRVGLCGTVALEDGAVRTIRKLSSAAVRVARQFPGAAEEVLPSLLEGGRLESALILAPPGLGKTTLLRDLVRGRLRRGGGASPAGGGGRRAGEIAALFDGVPQLDVGPRTDVMEGCPKAWGLMTLLRGMNPPGAGGGRDYRAGGRGGAGVRGGLRRDTAGHRPRGGTGGPVPAEAVPGAAGGGSLPAAGPHPQGGGPEDL